VTNKVEYWLDAEGKADDAHFSREKDNLVPRPRQNGPSYLVVLNKKPLGYVWRCNMRFLNEFCWRWQSACGHLSGRHEGDGTRQMAANFLVANLELHDCAHPENDINTQEV
jgi:hypothetical protein